MDLCEVKSVRQLTKSLMSDSIFSLQPFNLIWLKIVL